VVAAETGTRVKGREPSPKVQNERMAELGGQRKKTWGEEYKKRIFLGGGRNSGSGELSKTDVEVTGKNTSRPGGSHKGKGREKKKIVSM